MRAFSKSMVRFLLLAAAAALVIGAGIPVISNVSAAGDTVQVRLDASHIQPRPLEQLTGQAIVKQYSQSWKDMETALAENRPGVLDESFVGYAHDKLLSQIKEQQK